MNEEKKVGHDVKLTSVNDEYEDQTDPADIKIRVAGKIPLAAWFIIVTELCERFAFYGASLLFQPYMIKVLGFNKGTATAVNRGFQFMAYLTTILGAIIADRYFGKFKTIVFFSILYMVGLAILALSALPSSVGGSFGVVGFILSLYIFISFGTGGIKSNVSSFAAEQVKDGLYPTKAAGVYTDSQLTVERVFRFFYWAINLGALLGQFICPIIANDYGSYPIAFSLPAIMFVVGIIIFVAAKKLYFVKPPSGTVLSKTYCCIKYAVSHRKAAKSNHNSRGPIDHWLDYAKVDGVEWNAEFVDDLKKTLRACLVFLFYPFYWALYYNMSDNFINMGLTMERPSFIGGPEQLNLINSLVLVVAIPIFDSVIFPILRRMGCRLGPITRITIGFTIATFTFVYVTVLQHQVYSTGPYYDFTDLSSLPPGKEPVNNISIWWQVIPFIGIAISEIFASVTGLEFAFRQAAPELKSVVTALFLFTNCGGSLIGLILAIWSNDPYFVYVFGIQTGLMAVMTVVFYWLFRKYDS
ncbi:PTR2-domain-containing protein [Basidiobolus meristosporus CBS 931.73]|uniref:PTR2-domain-containing protein n=1 Tax=Basidiobolus meristosporus CBS 931.73 TaxID=1314790 RepID=A0A1Y1ZA09_9FUNG|nr:PTR2-domain-containing protein [Basidiobolus meristosporus CBS 931.73]|eukprot:ORY07110.1 PTR2-domain-containing protein [Basidiobolus meristosporus CBS 931.73]